MPIPKDSDSILGDNAQNEGSSEGDRQALHLQLRNPLASNSVVHAADGHGGGHWCWEDHAKLASNIDNEEFANYYESQ